MRYARTRPGEERVTKRCYLLSDINKSMKLMAEIAGIPQLGEKLSTKSFLIMFHTYIKEYKLKRNPNPHAISDMGLGIWNPMGGGEYISGK